MRQKAFYIFFLIIFLESCGIFNKMGENLSKGLVSSFPDKCDLELLSQIIKYHYDSISLPYESDLSYFINLMDTICQQSYDSIQLMPYFNDSIDLSVIKSSQDTTGLVTTIFNKYRIKFSNDTTNDINIIEGHTIINGGDGPKLISRWKNDKITK